MSNVVKLVGSWPKGFEQELGQVIPANIQVENAGDSSLGAVSLGDIGSLLSASAAVVTVAISLWNRRKLRNPEEAPDLDDLNRDTKRNGVFGVRVETVRPSAGDPGVVAIEVVDETSGGSFRFEATIREDGVTVAIDRDE